MSLGFSVEELLPRARGGGRLRMGLAALEEGQWLQSHPDCAQRAAAFDADPDAVQLTSKCDAPAAELGAMLGVSGGLEGAARSVWEDICLLTQDTPGEPYRLVGAAVAFPSDWCPAEKIGLPLTQLHAPIHGYAEQLATGVDRFMAQLEPDRIFGRCNWFIAPTDARRWRADPPEHAFAGITAANVGDRLFVRCERQTLRKLPQTGAIVFTIGVYVSPIGALSRHNLAFLMEALATLPPQEAQRRGTGLYSAALKNYADGRRLTADDAAPLPPA